MLRAAAINHAQEGRGRQPLNGFAVLHFVSALRVRVRLLPA
ncbi:MAG: hypothetical protein ACT6R7_16470 [Brevundimonas aurantiaca]|jgi:hypothetical protein